MDETGGDPRLHGEPTCQEAGPRRDYARRCLERRINELRMEADHLEVLSEALPLVLPPEADMALWNLLTRFER